MRLKKGMTAKEFLNKLFNFKWKSWENMEL
jgi:hypothetical protein